MGNNIYKHGITKLGSCSWCNRTYMVEKVYEGKDMVDKPLEYLGLTTKTFNCILRYILSKTFYKRCKCKITIGEVTELTVSEVMGIYTFGPKCLNELIEKLGNHGLSLKQE